MRRLLLIVLCLFLLSGVVCGAESEVTSLKADITVGEDGTCELALTAEVNFSGSPDQFVLPLSEDAGKITVSGGSYKIRRIDGVRCIVFKNDFGFTGKQTFTCTYRLPCSVEKTEEKQVFTLRLPEKGWDYSIKSLQMHIVFPAEIEYRPLWDSAYHKDIVDNYLNIQVKGKELTVKSNGSFRDQETITMTLSFPSEAFRLRHLPGGFASVSSICFYALLLLTVVYWLFFLRGKLLLPKVQRTYGMEATAGEIPCQLFGELPDVAATLAHWGNLGYVGIYRNSRGRIILRKQMEMGNERKPAEQKLFNALFRGSNTCDLQGLRFHTLAKPASASLRFGWNQRNFDRKSGSPVLLKGMSLLASLFVCLHLFDYWVGTTAWRWVFIPILALLCTLLCVLVRKAVCAIIRPKPLLSYLAGAAAAALLLVFASKGSCTGMMLLNLLLQIFCAFATLFGGKRTEIGREQVRQLLGLRRYLKKADSDSLQQLSVSDSQYFYRMLPFAELLGVARPFCKHFARWTLEPCPWLSDAKFTPQNAVEFYRLYEDILSAVRETPGRIPNLPIKAGKK